MSCVSSKFLRAWPRSFMREIVSFARLYAIYYSPNLRPSERRSSALRLASLVRCFKHRSTLFACCETCCDSTVKGRRILSRGVQKLKKLQRHDWRGFHVFSSTSETRIHGSHNPALYQLSYAHRKNYIKSAM